MTALLPPHGHREQRGGEVEDAGSSTKNSLRVHLRVAHSDPGLTKRTFSNSASRAPQALGPPAVLRAGLVLPDLCDSVKPSPRTPAGPRDSHPGSTSLQLRTVEGVPQQPPSGLNSGRKLQKLLPQDSSRDPQGSLTEVENDSLVLRLPPAEMLTY